MADEQKKAVPSQPGTTAKSIPLTKSRPIETERWVQDALEDDDVREALKRLHTREGSRG